MTQLRTKFEIKTWDERPYREHTDGRRFSRADVELRAEAADIDASATMESLLYYSASGRSSFGGLMHIDGRLGDRSGTLTLRTTGEYDGTEARFTAEIVDATGDLDGAAGTGSSTSTHADYPNMPFTLDYHLP